MSYYAYITRGTFWAENQGFEIPAAEWLQVIDSDSELERDERNGPFFAVFTGSVKCIYVGTRIGRRRIVRAFKGIHKQ